MTDDPEEDPGPDSGVPDPASRPTRGGRVWLAALAAGLIATALGGTAGELAVRSIPTEKEGTNVNGEDRSIVTVLSANRSDVKRATWVDGLQGAILGLALGLAGATAVRSREAAPAAALAGLIGGGVAGAGAASGLFPILFRLLDPISGDLLLPLIIHIAVWSPVGAAGGLAFGIGRGGAPGHIARSALGGLAGAALGVAAYQLLGAFFFPAARSDMPIAEDAIARTMGLALIGLATAAGVANANAHTSANRPAHLPQTRPERASQGS